MTFRKHNTHMWAKLDFLNRWCKVSKGTFTHVGTLLLTFSNLCDHYGVLTDGNNSTQRMTTVATDCNLVKGKKREEEAQNKINNCKRLTQLVWMRPGNLWEFNLASNVFFFVHIVFGPVFASSEKHLRLTISKSGLEAAVDLFQPKHI